MAYVTPTTRADGYVVDAAEWNKNTVDNPIALRTGALALASQAANDLIYASSGSQLARLAAGTAGQILQTNGAGSPPSWVDAPVAILMSVCGRLTLSTGTPVTTSDVTAATTLYFALYRGNQIALYTGSAWATFAIAELSIAVPSTTNTLYDVFVDYNAGTPQLALTAWTNDTTRATALTKQDGVLVKTGATGQRYVGSFRTTGSSGQTEDSVTKRYVWNYYNRTLRQLLKTDATANWDYTTATIRQANNAAANQVDVVIGVQEALLDLSLQAAAKNTTGVSFAGGIGEDSTSTFAVGGHASGSTISPYTANLRKLPAIGRHVYSWNEWSAAAGTTTFYGTQGDSTPANTANGLRGWIEG